MHIHCWFGGHMRVYVCGCEYECVLYMFVWYDECCCMTLMSMWIVTLNGDNNGLSANVFYMRYLDDIHKMLLLYKFQWCFSVCLFHAWALVFLSIYRSYSLDMWPYESYIDKVCVFFCLCFFFYLGHFEYISM